MKIRRCRSLRMRCEAQAQPSSRGMQSVFELHTGKPDFVSISPRQTRRLIAQVPDPSQRCLQREASLLKKRDYVIGIPRLFPDANCKKPKQYPAKKGSDGRREKPPSSDQNNSNQDENSYENEKIRKKSVRRII